jgi:GAF domain-containing protein
MPVDTLEDKFVITIHSETDEAERIREINRLQLLETGSEEAFDRIIHTAAHLFTVPIALMCIITDELQWFKAYTGLPRDLEEARSTPRAISFCQHVVASKSPLIIEDTIKDEYFRDNPLVKEAGIRFYAGVPVATNDGIILGTICIIDVKPRVFSKEEFRLLRNLGAWASAELERREAKQLATRSYSASRIITDANSILEGMELTEQLAIKLGFDRKDGQLLKLAVEEACTNAFEHGKANLLKVYWNVSEARIEIVCIQQGKSYSIANREIDVQGPRGRGLFLIQSIMDDTVLYENDGAIELRMRKRVNP